MSVFRKKAGLDRGAFQRHWEEVHAPIAVRIPGLQRYEQNHVDRMTLRGRALEGAGEIAGICKLHFQDASAMQSVLTPEMTKVLLDDEAKFIDGLRTFVVRPEIVSPLRATDVIKCMTLVTRCAALSAAEFEEGWRDVFAPWLAGQPGVRGYAQYYVTHRTVNRHPATHEQSPVDCIDELWLDPVRSADIQALIWCMQDKAAPLADATASAIVRVNVPAIPAPAGRAIQAQEMP